MTQPDYEAARSYALGRLERELAPQLVYHSLWHTRDDVLPGVERLAEISDITGEPLALLRTAAVYHDLGFLELRTGHEEVSARLAAEVLPGFGYSTSQVALIVGMIQATRLPQSPQTFLEELLADADLDVLGRTDFEPRNQALRAEMAAYGTVQSDEEWNQGQLSFITSHTYFTPAAHQLRDEQKQLNIQELKVILKML